MEGKFKSGHLLRPIIISRFSFKVKRIPTEQSFTVSMSSLTILKKLRPTHRPPSLKEKATDYQVTTGGINQTTQTPSRHSTCQARDCD